MITIKTWVIARAWCIENHSSDSHYARVHASSIIKSSIKNKPKISKNEIDKDAWTYAKLIFNVNSVSRGNFVAVVECKNRKFWI